MPPIVSPDLTTCVRVVDRVAATVDRGAVVVVRRAADDEVPPLRRTSSFCPLRTIDFVESRLVERNDATETP